MKDLSNSERNKKHNHYLKLLYTACLFDIHVYLTPLGQVRQFIKTCGHKTPSVEGNLFTFGLICFFCPGSQNNNILTYKRISNEQGVNVFVFRNHPVWGYRQLFWTSNIEIELVALPIELLLLRIHRRRHGFRRRKGSKFNDKKEYVNCC